MASHSTNIRFAEIQPTGQDRIRFDRKILQRRAWLLAGVVFAAGSLGGQGALAQESGGDTTVLEPVEVSAEADSQSATGPVDGYVATRSASGTKTDTPLIETPQSISVITADQLDRQNAQSMAEALRYTPGIQGESFGLETRLTWLRIRGFDATEDGVYRDGLRMANPNFAVGYNLEPYGAERVEVPRGPASVLFGQGAPGGLVNYVSKRPTFESFGEIQAEAGSFNRYQTRFDFGAPIGEDESMAFRLTGVVRDSDTQTDFTQDDRIYIAPSFSWRNDDTQITVLAHAQQDRSKNSQRYPADGTLSPNPNGTIPIDTFLGEPSLDQYNRNEYAIGYQLEHSVNDAVTLRQNARYYKNSVDDRVTYPTSIIDDRTVGRSVFESYGEVDGFTLDNQAEFKTTTGVLGHTLLVGADYQRFEGTRLQRFGGATNIDVYDPIYDPSFSTGPRFTNDRVTQEQFGIYLQDQIELDRWRLILGGRYDWAEADTLNRLTDEETSESDGEFTGRAALAYVFDNGVTPYVSYAQSFLPTAGVDASGGAFEPETGEQYEAGVKYQPPGYNSFVTAAVYQLTRENFVTSDPVTFENFQRGEARSRGLELQGLADLGNGLSVIASYTYLDSEVRDSAVADEIGEPLDYASRHKGSLWADYTFQEGTFRDLTLGGGVRYIGEAAVARFNAFNGDEVPSVTLVDAAASYQLNQNAQLQLNVQNLTDEEYVAAAFTSGPGLYTSYGLGRVITGSVRYRF